ncbi:glycosyltransferase family 2 protein [Alteromonas sp.]|nr:glycosyltransferase family 2 protein [Alteromonas sp.]
MNRIELLKKANSLLLDKNYKQALEIYGELSSDNTVGHSDLYAYNIFYCKRKLGILPSENNLTDNKNQNLISLFKGERSKDIVFIHADKFVLQPSKQIEKLFFYIAPMRALINNIFIISDSVSKRDIQGVDAEFNNLVDISKIIGVEEFESDFISSLSDNPIAYIYNEQSVPKNSQFSEKTLRLLAKKAGNIWRISDNVQHHGSFYLKSLSDKFSSQRYQEQFKEKLNSLKVRNESGKSYIFGTGPSIKYAYCNEELQKSIVITCNSVVKNPTMLEYLKPDIVCATDPIFHAGWGKYGDEFRKSTIESMREHDYFFVVPHRDLHIYLHTFPQELHSRIGAYEFDGTVESINLNLLKCMKSAPKPNVLTNIMLPIAATISKEIFIGGCDGKKNASSYFWEHDKASQLNNQMDDIQKEFKGFFDISYDKYYEEHCNTLSRQIEILEENAYVVKGCTPSYIPALSKRLELDKKVTQLFEGKTDITIVMPCHNMAKTIEKSIDSVISSGKTAGATARIIIINECSTDNTEELLNHRYKEELNRGDIVVVNTIGLGVSCARNIGLALSNSDFVGFLDGDDLISDNSFNEKLKVLKSSDNQAIGAFSKTQLVSVETNEVLSVANNYRNEGFKYLFKNIHAPAHISSILYVKDSIEGNTFPVGETNGEDWLFLSRVLRNGGYLHFCDSPYSVYSIHENSVTKKSPETHIIKLFAILQTIYFTDDSIQLDAENYQGLSSFKGVPTYETKLSELLVRLLACFYIKNKANSFHKVMCELSRNISFTSLDLPIEKNKKQLKEAFDREVKRFSGTNHHYSTPFDFLLKAKVSNIVPDLHMIFS